MSDEQNQAEESTTAQLSQADIYDSLRRIGELEDEKRTIQTEIDSRTAQLREAVKDVDQSSLLYKLLASALSVPSPPAKRQAPKSPRRTAKKSRRKPRTK